MDKGLKKIFMYQHHIQWVAYKARAQRKFKETLEQILRSHGWHHEFDIAEGWITNTVIPPAEGMEHLPRGRKMVSRIATIKDFIEKRAIERAGA